MNANEPRPTALASSWLAFGRIAFGLFWLYEVTIGHNWKIGNPKWFGEGAGEWLREDIANAVATGTWGWAQFLLETTIAPYAAFLGYVVTGLQLIIAFSLILGLFVRPIAAVGLAHTFVMFLTGHSRIPPFFVVGFLLVLGTHAGVHYGLDKLLLERWETAKSSAARFLSWTINLSLPDWTRRYVAIPLAAAGGMYFFLQMAALDSARFRMASIDLAMFAGLILVGLALGKSMDRLALVGRLTGLFVGYKFLHEIWIRSTPAVNGLPGWATAEELAEPFKLVAERHFAPIGWLAGNVFANFSGFWLFVFGIVQLAVGLSLILGYRTRLAGKVGMGYLAFLLVFGFARYTPFVFALLIVAHILGAERVLSVKSLSPSHSPAWTLPVLSNKWLIGTVAVFAVTLLIAVFGGIIPGDYRERMGAATAAMIAMLTLPLAVTAIIHRLAGLAETASAPSRKSSSERADPQLAHHGR